MVSKKMAARPQSKVASRAAGCNYEPAEYPAASNTAGTGELQFAAI